MMLTTCTRSEMDIITDFGSVVGGSSPSGCTKKTASKGRFSTALGGRSFALAKRGETRSRCQRF